MASESERSAEDMICKICLSLLIPPVTLPCGHEMCGHCFDANASHVSLRCPFCRIRISCWARNARKNDRLVNRDKWLSIINRFPQLLVSQEERDSVEQQLDACLQRTPIQRLISADGEVGQEFEHLMREQNEIQMKEEEESIQLIARLLEEDNRVMNERRKQSLDTANDEMLAKRLQKQEYDRISGQRLRDSEDWYEFRTRKTVQYLEDSETEQESEGQSDGHSDGRNDGRNDGQTDA